MSAMMSTSISFCLACHAAITFNSLVWPPVPDATYCCLTVKPGLVFSNASMTASHTMRTLSDPDE